MPLKVHVWKVWSVMHNIQWLDPEDFDLISGSVHGWVHSLITIRRWWKFMRWDRVEEHGSSGLCLEGYTFLQLFPCSLSVLGPMMSSCISPHALSLYNGSDSIRPETTEASDHGLTFLKLWAKLNSSFKLFISGILLWWQKAPQWLPCPSLAKASVVLWIAGSYNMA
jgi:hypothetical protein